MYPHRNNNLKIKIAMILATILPQACTSLPQACTSLCKAYTSLYKVGDETNTTLWRARAGREIRNFHYGQLPWLGVGWGLGRGLCPLPRCWKFSNFASRIWAFLERQKDNLNRFCITILSSFPQGIIHHRMTYYKRTINIDWTILVIWGATRRD